MAFAHLSEVATHSAMSLAKSRPLVLAPRSRGENGTTVLLEGRLIMSDYNFETRDKRRRLTKSTARKRPSAISSQTRNEKQLTLANALVTFSAAC